MLVFLRRLIGTSLSSIFFFLMIRRPPRSTLDRSSAASDVYKRQRIARAARAARTCRRTSRRSGSSTNPAGWWCSARTVSYTHLRAHETVLDLVCRLLLEKKKQPKTTTNMHRPEQNTDNRTHTYTNSNTHNQTMKTHGTTI